MTNFVLNRNRDAWFTIRGYVYQVELTLLRWLELQGDEVLKLERGEDIDLVALIAPSSDDEQRRILEQVKHLKKISPLNMAQWLRPLQTSLNTALQTQNRTCTSAL